MLVVQGLIKRFGTRVAVNGVSFTIKDGETVGLLGPNGAGKTTTLAMVSGLLAPDSGSVSVDAVTMGPGALGAKRRVGLVPQDLALIEELSADANLELFGGLYGLTGADLKRRVREALELVQLQERAHECVKHFSGGMKRRLNIAGALLHDPTLVLLDEPTVGVDPQSRSAIFANLEELKRRGKTLLYTTHYMEEAERLCDRIVILDHGCVVADDTIAGLRRRLPPARESRLTLERAATAEVCRAIGGEAGIDSVQADGETLVLQTQGIGEPLARALAQLARAGIGVLGIQTAQPRLEDVFIALTGHALRDEEGA